MEEEESQQSGQYTPEASGRYPSTPIDWSATPEPEPTARVVGASEPVPGTQPTPVRRIRAKHLISDLERSHIAIGDFITMLSAVEWTDEHSNPETCDASTFNSGVAYFTRIYWWSTELQRRRTTMLGKIPGWSWRISQGKVSKGEDRGFLEGVRTVAPRLYIGSFHNVQLVADRHYATDEEEYISPYPVDSWIVPNEMIYVLYL
ncbi:hypothetical protein B9Z19DRAFT_1130377 [Tuber borchii]|uniref:Uncharacterized protein n=1 Tax=Tuber borchii TaxID=42251 RepID=A0A2T6ZKP4_TUBBO|nr:hypothetical protein B9Z19DRAFT_1130377 [Tuber borchii]